MTCAACGLATSRELCNFCSRTAELIRQRRCVSCAAPVFEDGKNVQGKCGNCLARNHRLSRGTRWLLHKSAQARYWLKDAA